MSDQPRVALVTGATAGLGKEIAIRLSANGWSVAFCGRRTDRVRQLESAISRVGHHAVGFVGDVADASFCDSFVDGAREALGEPRVLVNNAAILGPTGSALETTSSDLVSTLEVNVIGCLAVIRALLNGRAENRGVDEHTAIVNIAGGGIGGRSLEWSAFPYVGSKAVLYYLTEILAAELRETNTTVNCLAPGALPTEFMSGAIEKASRDGDVRLLSEIEKRRSMDGEASFDKVHTWIEALARPEFGQISGRLLSAIWDDPAEVLSAQDSPDLYRLRRIDGQMFGPL